MPYVIRNCPCFFEENEEVNDYTCSWCGTEELACQDCTDCKLKQIVELCKEENAEGENLASIMRLSNKDTKEFLSRFASNKILKLLNIEEVE